VNLVEINSYFLLQKEEWRKYTLTEKVIFQAV